MSLPSSSPSSASPHPLPSKRPHDFWIILILGALCTITPFSIDMYLPAFPEMAAAMGTTVAQISFSVSSYFIGFALGQIFYGPLLDRFGRKKPLYFGLILYFFATIACLKTESVEQLIVFRFIQALGGCAAQVASTSMVRDFFGAEKSGKIFSLLVLILGASPLPAPTIGGFLTTAYGWQSVFIFLLIADVLLLLAVFFILPESHSGDKTVSLRPKPILMNFYSILREPQFYTFGFAGALSFAVLFVYVAGSPVIFMENFHLSAKTYGLMFALLSVGFIGGSQVNLLLLKWFKERQIFTWALTAQALVSIVLIGAAVLGHVSLELTLVAIFLMMLSLGLINPNAAAIALVAFSRNIGSAAALLGFIQIGAGAIASLGVGFLSGGQMLPIFAVFSGCAVLALVILKIGERQIVAIVTGEPALAPVLH